MQFKQLLNDDEAVSPVIGVILMVAITVILAAVIGTFVLGLGDQVQTTAPNANFQFDYDSGNTALTVTHSGGDGVESNELILRGAVSNADADYSDTPADLSWDQHGYSDQSVKAGDQVTIKNASEVGAASDGEYAWNAEYDADGQVAEDESIRVVWADADSDQSSTLRTWTRG